MSIKNSHDPMLITILDEVCAAHGITPEMARGRHRKRRMVAARREFCRRAWALQVFSSPEIGGMINRDHATVLYHCGVLKKDLPKWAMGQT